jgi:hypothetical protein
MPGSSNFLVFNPTCANQELDATYSADVTRTGGIVFDQTMSSLLANKLMYQVSVGVAGLMAAMANKGFNPNDGNGDPAPALANLAAVMANVLTTADYSSIIAAVFPGVAFNFTLGGSSYLKMGSNFGGLILQFGLVSLTTNPQTFTLPVAFTTSRLAGFISTPSIGNPNTAGIAFSGGLSNFEIEVFTGFTSGIEYWYLVLGH